MNRIISAALAVTALALATSPVHAQGTPSQIEIKPLAVPEEPSSISLLPKGKKPAFPGEQWEKFLGGRVVRNVVTPTLTPYLPDPAKATGAAVVVAPGGAFMMLSIDNEGHDVARWLASRGIAAFVLKYRLKETPRDSQAFVQGLMQMMYGLAQSRDSGQGAPLLAPPETSVADALAAVALVRARAAEWRVDPSRVGMVGFSAGAMLTMTVGLSSDPTARPDFIASIYGPMHSRTVPADAPPMFAAIAADDPLFSGMSAPIAAAWLAAKRPAELHVYERGGHGFGMKQQGATSDRWIDEFYWWMGSRGLLRK